MAFTPKNPPWADDAAGNTPITAAELNRIEAGIEASVQLDEAQTVTGTKTFPPNALLMQNAAGTLTAEPYSDINAPQTLMRTLHTPPAGNPPAGTTFEWTPDGKSVVMRDSNGVDTVIGPSAGGSGQPSLLVTSQIQVIKNPGAATVTAVGTPAPTLTATAASADEADGRWLNQTTTAVIANASGVISGFNVTQRSWISEAVFTVKTGAAITTARHWVGLFSASPDAAATPAISLAAFRYDTVSDTTAFWRCVTAGGSATQQVTVTTIPVAVTTAYRFRVKLLAASVEFYANDVLVATHTTAATLPVSTTQLGYGVRITTLAAATRSIKWGRVAVIDYA